MLLQYQKTCYDTIHETFCYNIRSLVTIQFLKCCYYIRSHVTIQFLKHNVKIFDPQLQFSQYVPEYEPLFLFREAIKKWYFLVIFPK